MVRTLKNPSAKPHAPGALLKTLDFAVVNRALDAQLGRDPGFERFVGLLSAPPEPPLAEDLIHFLNFMQSYLATQQRVCDQLVDFANHVLTIPVLPHLDDQTGGLRMRDLGALGATLMAQMALATEGKKP